MRLSVRSPIATESSSRPTSRQSPQPRAPTFHGHDPQVQWTTWRSSAAGNHPSSRIDHHHHHIDPHTTLHIIILLLSFTHFHTTTHTFKQKRTFYQPTHHISSGTHTRHHPYTPHRRFINTPHDHSLSNTPHTDTFITHLRHDSLHAVTLHVETFIHFGPPSYHTQSLCYYHQDLLLTHVHSISTHSFHRTSMSSYQLVIHHTHTELLSFDHTFFRHPFSELFHSAGLFLHTS